MTLANCELLLAHYAKCIVNNDLSEQARLNAKLAHADMVENLARKGHPVDNKNKSKK